VRGGGPEPLRVRIAEPLRLFLSAAHRGDEVGLTPDGTSSLGHVVEALGVPLTEVGRLVVAAPGGLPAEVRPSHRPGPGDVVVVEPVRRPQRVEPWPPRFLLDVHLGTLARRLRVLGIDAAYDNAAHDDALVRVAATQQRVLLTKDRGLLRRRALERGAYVHGSQPDEQLRDVLERFVPPLAPYTRCTACNGPLEPVAKETVLDVLEPGTRRRYDRFSRCADCGAVYWRGAHAARLDAVVAAAGVGHDERAPWPEERDAPWQGSSMACGSVTGPTWRPPPA
jgi:uncharacterized protein